MYLLWDPDDNRKPMDFLPLFASGRRSRPLRGWLRRHWWALRPVLAGALLQGLQQAFWSLVSRGMAR
jgi:hypothetical protein